MKHQIALLFIALNLSIVFEAAHAGDTINVMIVATPAAINGLGGPDSTSQKVRTDINNINQSFINSRIQAYIKVVYTNPFNVVEGGCMYDLLNEVLTVRTGELGKLNEIRTNFAADVVIIIVNEPSQCGISGRFTYPNEAFILLHYECIGANYSMARQLGYLLGCGNHESQCGRFNLYSMTAYAYFHDNAEDIPEESFSTIMGYTDERISSNESDFDMIPYWSSADTINVRYHGKPVGDEDHDNAGQIRSALNGVSAYRYTFGMLRQTGITLLPYNTMRLKATRKLEVSDVVVEPDAESTFRSKRARFSGNVRIKKGAKARMVSFDENEE